MGVGVVIRLGHKREAGRDVKVEKVIPKRPTIRTVRTLCE